MYCPECLSPRMHKKETVMTREGAKRRYRCYDCNKSVYESETHLQKVDVSIFSELNAIRGTLPKKVVVTSAIVGFDINEDFLKTLESYCEKNGAVLSIVPIAYKNTPIEEWKWNSVLEPYYLTKDWYFNGKFKIIAECAINPAAGSPLSGMEALSESMTTIIGHPQLQMKTIPVNPHRDHVILTTTGSISCKTEYKDSKAGYRAEFNHCFCAILVEREEDESFHMRQLLADHTGGFYDLTAYYRPDGVVLPSGRIEALVTGDEHAIFISPEVLSATYTAEDSIVNTLKPKVIVRHDVLDCFSISHHDANNYLGRFRKFVNGMNTIETELNKTCQFIIDTTPDNTETWIVNSNHNNHLTKWLNTAETKTDLANAEMYHMLMLWSIREIKQGRSPDPFEMYFSHYAGNIRDEMNVQFLEKDEFREVMGNTVSMHGDLGPNGSRGSRNNLSRIGERCIIGHSHSPGIERGCWQTGTSSHLSLDYTSGPSSWANTHILVHANGKRQMINIIGGKWRLS